MAHFQSRYCWLLIVAGIASCISPLAYAEDPTAQAVLQRWEQTLRNSGRLAVRFRSERINHVFRTKEERLGVFYRDEQGNAAFRSGECLNHPPSAVQDINAQLTRVYNYDEPGLVCAWNHSSSGVDVGKYPKLVSYSPPSAMNPDNAPTFAGWYFSRAFADHFSPPNVFPLMFVESPEVGWYDAELLTNAKSPNVCLRLSLPPGTTSNRTPSVDALFRPAESLPFAIRRFDPTRTIEFRFFIESIQTGDNAVIPDDAFQLTTDH